MLLASELIEQEIIPRIDSRIVPIEVSAVANGRQIVQFKCLKWIKLFDVVYNNGNEVNIISYLPENRVVFQVDLPALKFELSSIVTLKKPIFLTGTLSNTKYEWDRFELSEREKLPFIWLVSPTNRRKADSKSSTYSFNLDLWFVHWSNWEKLNADREDEAVKPLLILTEWFLKAIESNKSKFTGYKGLDLSEYPKFGKREKNGIESTLFNSTLSAVHCTVEISSYDDCCDC